MFHNVEVFFSHLKRSLLKYWNINVMAFKKKLSFLNIPWRFEELLQFPSKAVCRSNYLWIFIKCFWGFFSMGGEEKWVRFKHSGFKNLFLLMFFNNTTNTYPKNMQSSQKSEMKLRSNANLSSIVNGIQLETILQMKYYSSTYLDRLAVQMEVSFKGCLWKRTNRNVWEPSYNYLGYSYVVTEYVCVTV